MFCADMVVNQVAQFALPGEWICDSQSLDRKGFVANRATARKGGIAVKFGKNKLGVLHSSTPVASCDSVSVSPFLCRFKIPEVTTQ